MYCASYSLTGTCPCSRTLIQADVVEELLVSAAIHHLELDPAIKMMGEEGGSSAPHLQKLFQGVSALLRRLQVHHTLARGHRWWKWILQCKGMLLS